MVSLLACHAEDGVRFYLERECSATSGWINVGREWCCRGWSIEGGTPGGLFRTRDGLPRIRKARAARNVHECERIILSYAFKMRQDYLSTSYLDQKDLPSERSETREIWIDPSNVCWDNPVSFWIHMMIFLSHLSLFNRWNIFKIWEKMSKWNLDGGPSHLRASYVLTT